MESPFFFQFKNISEEYLKLSRNFLSGDYYYYPTCSSHVSNNNSRYSAAHFLKVQATPEVFLEVEADLTSGFKSQHTVASLVISRNCCDPWDCLKYGHTGVLLD